MVELLVNYGLDLLNIFAIIGLSIITIRSTRKVEHLKSKLDLKTSIKKRYTEFQNNSLLQLVEDFSTIADLLAQLPRKSKELMHENLIDTYYEPIHFLIQPTKLALGKIKLFVENDTFMNHIANYNIILLKILEEKRKMLEELSKIENFKEAKDIYQAYRTFLTQNLYQKEYQDYIKATREFLKKSFN